MSAGVRMSTPATSPIHHVSATVPQMPPGMMPPPSRLAEPRPALTRHITSAAPTKRSTAPAVPSALSAPIHRRNSQAPASASSVLPIAMLADTAPRIAKGVVWLLANTARFATNAPANTPGQTREPSSSTAANASPDGGHTGDAFVFSNASTKPNRAAT